MTIQANLVNILSRSAKYPESKARSYVFNMMLFGTLIIFTLLLALLFTSYYIDGNRYIVPRIIVNLVAVLYLFVVAFVSRKNEKLASILFVSMYSVIASLSMWQWGIHLAMSILLMSITITLSGILLNSKAALIMGLYFISFLLFVQGVTDFNIHIPDASWQTGRPSEFGESIGYLLLFTVLTSVSWIFGRQTERALIIARKAENELRTERNNLDLRLKLQSKRLKEAQKKEIQQLYRFAELGQLSSIMIHDLANHLSVLSLDLEGLKSKQEIKIKALEDANQSLSYIDQIVRDVRSKLKSDKARSKVSISNHVNNVIVNISKKIQEYGIKLKVTFPKGKLFIDCDSVKFEQVLSILLNNAIEASIDCDKKIINVDVLESQDKIIINICDYGKGIKDNEKTKLFDPVVSTKKSGMGLGLYIARQIIETHFDGKISLERSFNPTIFSMELPLNKKTQP